MRFSFPPGEFRDRFVRIGRSLRVLVLEICLPVAAFVLATNAALDSHAVVTLVDAYRPALVEVPLSTYVETEVWHLHAASRVPASGGRVVFTGSSSVVNGIDTAILDERWRDAGLSYEAADLGATGLLAYELPILKRVLLGRDVRTVVYLYNTFSFAANVHPQAVATRWDTDEMLGLFDGDALDPDTWYLFARGFIAQQVLAVRYSQLLRESISRAVTGRAVPMSYTYNYDPAAPEPPPHWRPRVLAEPAPASNWIRAAYLESRARSDDMGYRGLRRFLALASARRVQVIVMPVPEPDFAEYEEWKQGIDNETIDARVEAIARAYAAPYVPRSRIRAIEADDLLFRDHVHLNQAGRAAYSRWLAEELVGLLR
jgi:hypothetical protein